MKIKIMREDFIRPLQGVTGVVERRQTLPILSNVKIEVTLSGAVKLTTSDLEVEMVAEIKEGGVEAGAITVPARKLLDICRALPEGAEISLKGEEGKLRLTAGRGRFSLATLAPDEFPEIGKFEGGLYLEIPKDTFAELLRRTSFAMAQQDVRYYLTGLLLEVDPHHLRAVATNGHRLALCDIPSPPSIQAEQAVIVPRKAITELERLVPQADKTVNITINVRTACFSLGTLSLTTKLIEGQFPDYSKAIPPPSRHRLLVDRAPLSEALARVAILTNERFHGVRLETVDGGLKLAAHNPENEEAEEMVLAHYEGENVVIAFNANYLQDALTALSGAETVELSLTDANSSILMNASGKDDCRYVIMPMRL